ncbi:asparaginase [Pilibacter termitis]|nr:asparaginase [Pilibacter termitis]
MRKILALHTGGTISMHEDELGQVLPGEENPIARAEIALPENVEIINEEIFNLPSPHITPAHMLQLKERILYAIQHENVQGIVITHGTDTLEETAYFLDSTIQLMFPIVLTGAMRSSNELGSDGLYNFLSALRVASDNKAIGKGVLVVMNDEIHTARYVTKTHTTNVATFRTPTHGPIGIVTKTEIVFFHQLQYQEKYNISTVDGNIPIIKAYAGMTDEIFNMLDFHKTNGLVIEALGAGNLPPKVLEGLKKVLLNDIPVVLVSRCFNGIAEPVYAYTGGGMELAKLGVMFSNGINSQKARLKLLIGLNAKLKGTELSDFIHDA